jgi:hypothetical protein
VLRQAADNGLDFAGARRLSYLLAFVEGDAATMARELDASVGVGETNSAFGWQAHTSAFAGHISRAHEQFRRGIQMSLQGNFTEVAAQLMMEDAETHAVAGQCEAARSEVRPGLELSRDNATLERASRILALCGSPAEVAALNAELLRRFPEATLTRHLLVPVASAAVALRQGDAAGAIERLEGVRQYDRSASAEFWPNYLRGQAYLQRDDRAAAAAEFQAILDHRGEHPASMLYPLAYLGLARSTTDPVKARDAYGKMLGLWNEADAGLRPLEDARAEQAQVR